MTPPIFSERADGRLCPPACQLVHRPPQGKPRAITPPTAAHPRTRPRTRPPPVKRDFRALRLCCRPRQPPGHCWSTAATVEKRIGPRALSRQQPQRKCNQRWEPQLATPLATWRRAQSRPYRHSPPPCQPPDRGRRCAPPSPPLQAAEDPVALTRLLGDIDEDKTGKVIQYIYIIDLYLLDIIMRH